MTQGMRMLAKITAAVGIMIGMLGAGCERPAAQTTAPEPPLRVAASVYALADLAREVGGRHVQVSWVLERGQSLDGFQPSPAQAGVVRNADLVLAGGMSEPWAVEGFAGQIQSNRIMRMDLLSEAADLPLGTALWLDPAMGKTYADELSRRIILLRPGNEAELQENARRLKGQIDALQTEFAEPLESVKDKSVIVLTEHFDALLARYGIRPRLVLRAVPQRLGEMELMEIRRDARERKIEFIVLDTSTPEALMRVVAAKTGLKTVEIEVLGSSSPATGPDTYLKLCRHNLQELRKLAP